MAVASGCKIKTSVAIDANKEKGHCAVCERLFTENALSKQSRETCICIGCKRLYAQCCNDLDMRLMKLIQTFKFGHGAYNNEMMSQQMIDLYRNYFTANKFKPNIQTDLHALTQMAERWDQRITITDNKIKGDISNDQHLDLSTLLNERAASFSKHTKKRYRKLYPDAKFANEKFIFPTQSQLKGFMEASNGICSWSGLRGQWRSERSSPLFLLSIDHIVPVSKHGSPNINNLQVVLSVYNSVKSNESESEFQRWLYC
ncbi:hypothetical protein MAM1_0179c07347 [Mucor ambiguus]|uniref:HNH nuclease domain-containing protein n=1 Tax=Mucor ambiguus TaxID=91626 RepID=A0A0C9MZX4_9FUNG|nr:hypothetical protein MAM1_0179c07347 [Mucor ambiguus]